MISWPCLIQFIASPLALSAGLSGIAHLRSGLTAHQKKKPAIKTGFFSNRLFIKIHCNQSLHNTNHRCKDYQMHCGNSC